MMGGSRRIYKNSFKINKLRIFDIISRILNKNPWASVSFFVISTTAWDDGGRGIK